jgi:hypothetical protein
MVQSSKFAVQLLEKIGAPLAASIESVAHEGEENDVEAAKTMAQLLGQAVQVSIALNNSLGLSETEEQADSTRLALAAIAAPLLGDFYAQNSRVPADQDIKRIVKSLEAVLAFADNFTPAAEGQSRLSTIDHKKPLFDETQTSLVVMQALTPAIQAIAECPFGQSENKLVQDVAARLQSYAADIEGSDKLNELMVFKSLAALYAECHRAETARLSSASDEERGDLSTDPIWDKFAARLEMIKVIAGVETKANTASSATTRTSAPSQEIQAEPVNVPQTPPVPAEPPSADNASAAPSNPMGFFKPGGEAPDPVPTPTSPPPAQPAPPVDTPPAPAPQEQEDSAAPSNPMGFFKPGTKKSDSGTSESS